MKDNPTNIQEIIENDNLDLLGISEINENEINSEEQRLIDSFYEITNFFEENNRKPTQSDNINEFKLFSRLESIKKNPKQVKFLLSYDFHDLLNISENKVISVEDIINNDPLSLLDLNPDDEDIHRLEHVKKNPRINPQFIARRKKVLDFDLYKFMFDEIFISLNNGSRKLVEIKKLEITINKFYVLKGMLMFLENLDTENKKIDFYSGSRSRIDGRTRCIFSNGTESNMLLRSLEKALQIDGFGISEILNNNIEQNDVADNDKENGYIYILKSLSQEKRIKSIPNFFKIGYCTTDVYNRIKNAKNDSTYLNNDVEIYAIYKCFNINIKNFESTIHNFFSAKKVDIEIINQDGKKYSPKEWFSVPYKIIDEAINILLNNDLNNYKYDPIIEKIILKENQ